MYIFYCVGHIVNKNPPRFRQTYSRIWMHRRQLVAVDKHRKRRTATCEIPDRLAPTIPWLCIPARRGDVEYIRRLNFEKRVEPGKRGNAE